MVTPPNRRATTLSISLTPELAAEVASRVQSGSYVSASELFREALRLFLKVETADLAPVRSQDSPPPLAALRLKSAAELQALGLSLQAERLRRQHPGLSDEELLERLQELASEQESGPGLRVSPERLAKLKLREPE